MLISLCSLIWIVCSVWVLLGLLFYSFPEYSPAAILDLYTYGKIRDTKSKVSVTERLLLPKSWFAHFYLSGVICVTTLLCLCLNVTCLGGDLPAVLGTVVNILRNQAKESYGDAFSNLIVLVCADVQVTRRFLECLTVSVYSPDGKISILVYIVGVTFYGALPLSSLAGTDYSRSISGTDALSLLRWHHLLGVLLFLWASYQQNRTAHLFAKLRQDKSGNVENTRHHIPRGGLFEYVSCPHYFVEILIYLSFNVIFAFRNAMMFWLFVFVLVNQVITGHFSHQWYKKTFKSYPKDRKSTIPFVF
ncbi:polyprenol reductase-like [Dreissena polymorpha]|uniref:polyprenol reductase-like n=1 Tax=Dreissena polymorpha TaxID=45954 RepID=UPI0022649F8B|nr:polyprenol reductase-like [Dreissena polymorpha]